MNKFFFKKKIQTWDAAAVTHWLEELKTCSNCVILSIQVFAINRHIPQEEISELRASTPIAVIHNENQSSESGVQLIATCIRMSDGIRFERYWEGGQALGTIVANHEWRWCSIVGLSVKLNSDNPSYYEIFELFAKICKQLKISPKNIYRTWYYLPNICRSYRAFNNARDRFFQNHEIRRYPASTAVGAGSLGGTYAVISFEACERCSSGDIPVQVIDSAKQLAPEKYGANFIRANKIDSGFGRLGNVSGISTVGPDGRSAYLSDIRAGVQYAYDSFLDVYRSISEGRPWDSISTIIYFKSDHVREVFQDYCSSANLDFDYTYTISDICREELYFEIERTCYSSIEDNSEAAKNFERDFLGLAAINQE